jgi:hypothetical protein
MARVGPDGTHCMVKPFFIMIVFVEFDELMLRHDVFSLLFSEIHTWIKKSIKCTWKV